MAVLAAGANIGVATASAKTESHAKTKTHRVAATRKHNSKAHVKRHTKRHAKKHVRRHARHHASTASFNVWRYRKAPWWFTKPTTTTTTTTTTKTTTSTTPPKTTVTTAPTTTSSTAPTGTQPNGPSGSWNLAFDDEFNGTSLNTSVWGDSGYTNNNMKSGAQASNVSETGGNLVLQVASSSSGAQVVSKSVGVAVGQYAEARVDFAGNGTQIDNWPAWWISGPNWPSAGESDIAEGLGTLTVNYHSPSGAHNQGTIPGDWAGGFHTYGIYRGSNYCNVYWDGKLVKTYSTDDNGQPEQLIFTNGIGNSLAFGASGQMLVDYVRVWSPA